jgi:hypothetical protein
MPVAEELRRRGAQVWAAVAGPAVSIWLNECSVETLSHADNVSLHEAQKALNDHETDVVLSASGLYNQIEHTFRLAARRLEISIVAVLDSWTNYAERFERLNNGTVVTSHPDEVCVMDDLTYEGMLAAGFEKEQLKLTGPPNLESSLRFHKEKGAKHRAAWRREHSVMPDDLLFLFFSEPFSTGPDGEHFEGPGAIIGADGESIFGYTSIDILSAVLEELDSECQAADAKCKLIIKPHPSEYADGLMPLVEECRLSHVDPTICTDGNAAHWIAVADAVVGMMSIALLEAALAGKPSLSVQLGLLESGEDDPCLGNVIGYTYPIYDRSTLRRALRSVCTGDVEGVTPSPDHPLRIEGAALRVAGVVEGSKPRRAVGQA